MPRLLARRASFPIALLLLAPFFAGCESLGKPSSPSTQISGSDAPAADSVSQARLTPDQALAKLQAGNERFAEGKLTNPNQDIARREAVAPKQRPYAVILGCSDSRVPPEVVFDAGLGDLFVVRVAGNVCSDSARASIEYAAENLGAPLIIVLGHDNCGAVSAAIDADKTDSHPRGYLYAITHSITPAVKQATSQPGDVLDNAIDDNVKLVVAKLKKSDVLGDLIFSGKVRVLGARYHLESGKVTFYPAEGAAAQN